MKRLVAAVACAAALSCLMVGSADSLTLTSSRLTTFQTCVVTATPNPTTAVADAYVDQSNPASNGGTGLLFSVAPDNSGGGRVLRGYVRFDLTRCAPSIPATATVRLATLRVAIFNFPAGACATEDVFAVTSAWSESGITWNTQPAGTTPDIPASANRSASAYVGGGGVPCPAVTRGSYIPWNVTADVARWVAGTATNNGWMIRHDQEGAGNSAERVDFVAKEAAFAAYVPQLIITYAP